MTFLILMEILLLIILVGGSYYGIIKGFFKMAAAPLKVVAGLVFSLIALPRWIKFTKE